MFQRIRIAFTLSFSLFAVVSMTACPSGEEPPPINAIVDGGPWADLYVFPADQQWAYPDQQPLPRPLDGGAPPADAASTPDTQLSTPIEQSPPSPGVQCSGQLTAEGTRWVKKGAGTQSIYDAPKVAPATPTQQGTAPEGGAMKFFPTASKQGWACVLYGGVQGYIDASMLTTLPPSAEETCKPGLTSDGHRWVKAGTGSLNLRSEPTSDGGSATVLTTIPEGASGKATYYPSGDEPGWACVAYGGKTGYAAAKYLSASPPPTPSNPTPTPSPSTGVCAKNTTASWCGPLTKPCDWRTTKGDCESVHWFTGIFNQNATPCCRWAP